MRGRLLPLTTASGSWNMAADQAVLESAGLSALPTLRLYCWSEPTLSLGYFQPYQSRNTHLASRRAECVRRATGGGAILHHHELTYSLVIPMSPSQTKRRQQLYEQVHAAVSDSLARFGIRATPYRVDGRTAGNQAAFLCFQRRTDEDLVVSGYKIVGSAQRRSRYAVLQHGGILLRASPLAPELPGVFELTSQTIDVEDYSARVAEHFGERLGIQWQVDELTSEECRQSDVIETRRFRENSWTHRR